MDKLCNRCGRILPLSDFHKDNSGRRKQGVVTQCKRCMAEKSLSYRSDPTVQAKLDASYAKWKGKNREHRAAYEAKRRITKRAQCLVANARTRARKKGVYFALDDSVEQIQRRIDAGRCEVTGTPFDLSPGRKFNSPSIDRIDPKAGYTLSNIRIICHALNAAMGNWGEDPVWEMFQNWAAMASLRKRRKRS